MRMGHAMVRPVPGTISSEERVKLKRRDKRILFANSDLSGISIFEEAQFHGVEAAQAVLRRLGTKNAAGKKSVPSGNFSCTGRKNDRGESQFHP
jgi:hypothetical protein